MAAAKNNKARRPQPRVIGALPNARGRERATKVSAEHGQVPPDSEESASLSDLAWAIQGQIIALNSELKRVGRPSAARWGASGKTTAERALSAALWMAHESMRDAGAWLRWNDSEHPGHERYIAAANVLRGGTRHESPGHWYEIAVGSFLSFFAINPRPAAEDAARQSLAALASVFGLAFEQVRIDVVTSLYSKAYADIDRVAQVEVARGGPLWGRFDDGRVRFDKVQSSVVLRLTKEVVWAGYQAAAQHGRDNDQEWFRFPMPQRANVHGSTGGKPTKKALYDAFATHQRDKEKKRRQRAKGR